MNQRIGVDHLQSARKRQSFIHRSAEHLRAAKQKARPDPLAAVQKSIAHALFQDRGS